MDATSCAWAAPGKGAAHVAVRRRALLLLCAAAAAPSIAAGCSRGDRPLAAPYVAPPAGTVYHYAGFANRVIESSGWRTRFADDSGRQGVRVGLFISDDPQHPSRIDSTQLAALWPLTEGKQTTIVVRSGATAWRWMFKVVGTQDVTVPAGRFHTYLVQAVQRPDSGFDPRKSTVVGYSWWYAPSIAAVVRFKTTYFAGAAKGRVVASALERVESPPAAAPPPATGSGQ